MSKSKKILRAILPDGKTATRETAREYKFIVAAHFDGSKKAINKLWDGWVDMSWNLNFVNAVKSERRLSGPCWRDVIETRIIPIQKETE